MRKEIRKRTHRPALTPPASALPPIPTDTPEGIRVHAIAETIRALDVGTEARSHGLELSHEEMVPLGKALGVPALFIELLNHESVVDDGTAITEEHVQSYIAWRHQLAGKAGV